MDTIDRDIIVHYYNVRRYQIASSAVYATIRQGLFNLKVLHSSSTSLAFRTKYPMKYSVGKDPKYKDVTFIF